MYVHVVSVYVCTILFKKINDSVFALNGDKITRLTVFWENRRSILLPVICINRKIKVRL